MFLCYTPSQFNLSEGSPYTIIVEGLGRLIVIGLLLFGPFFRSPYFRFFSQRENGFILFHGGSAPFFNLFNQFIFLENILCFA
jgi:hypothetical protein